MGEGRVREVSQRDKGLQETEKEEKEQAWRS
jgi:hypothetical protein